MDVDVFMRYMAGALHSAKVKLTDKQWETVAHRLHEPLPKLTDGQLFAYIGGAGGVVKYEMYVEGEIDLEDYANARPLHQDELGGMVRGLVKEFRTNGHYGSLVERFEEAHKPVE